MNAKDGFVLYLRFNLDDSLSCYAPGPGKDGVILVEGNLELLPKRDPRIRITPSFPGPGA
jgi:hypothetical protein